MSYFRFFVGSWGRVDSNHWTPKRTDLQSVAIATMRLPHVVPNPQMVSELEPMKGLEPPTGWLQISYSTNWVTSAFTACQTTLVLLIWGCKDTTFFQTNQIFFLIFFKLFFNKLKINCKRNNFFQGKFRSTMQKSRLDFYFWHFLAYFDNNKTAMSLQQIVYLIFTQTWKTIHTFCYTCIWFNITILN